MDDPKKNSGKNPDRKVKVLLKPLAVFFVIAFFLFNWENVSWIFNHKALFYTLPELLPHNELNKKQAENLIVSEEFYDREDGINIPGIQVEAPLVFGYGESMEDIEEALDRGVAHYPGSALPGEKGKVVILGHSAPTGWPEIKYHHIFNRLNELKKDDEVIIYFKNKKYQYKVIGKLFVEPGTELSSSSLTNSNYVLFLLSCWPPGKLYQRIVIEAEQVN